MGVGHTDPMPAFETRGAAMGSRWGLPAQRLWGLARPVAHRRRRARVRRPRAQAVPLGLAVSAA